MLCDSKSKLKINDVSLMRLQPCSNVNKLYHDLSEYKNVLQSYPASCTIEI